MKNENLEIRKTKLILKNEVFPSRKSIKFTEKQIPKNNVLDMKFNYSLEELPYLKQSLLSKNSIISRKLHGIYSKCSGRSIYFGYGILS
jgi:hypothetical protein